LAHDYNVDEYIKERLELLVREMDQLFPSREKSTQSELTDFEGPPPDLVIRGQA